MTNNLSFSLCLLLASLAANSLAGGLKSDAKPQWLGSESSDKAIGNIGKRSSLDNAAPFLAVDDAFTFTLNKDGDSATLVWIIAPEHYLYRHAFSVAVNIAKNDGSVEKHPLTAETLFSQGIKTTDDYFGPVEIYYYQATAQLPMDRITQLATLSDAANSQPQLSIQYQGCAEAGLCYPVQTRHINLP